MTVPSWPSILPLPERATYQAQRANSRLAKQGNGPKGYRRRMSSMPRLVSYSIEVSRAQKAVFDAFYEITTQDGAMPFFMPDPTTHNWHMLSTQEQTMRNADGTFILLSKIDLCLFGDETPVDVAKDTRFVISFSVQVMP